MAAGYIEVPAKLFLDEFVKMLGLNPSGVTGRVGQDGRSVVGIRVALGLADEARSLFHEATGVTEAEAEQATSLMVIHALANVRQVEIRDVNFPQVQFLCHQVVNLRYRVEETEKICAKLSHTIHNSENEMMFLECLSRWFYHRIRYLNETIAAM